MYVQTDTNWNASFMPAPLGSGKKKFSYSRAKQNVDSSRCTPQKVNEGIEDRLYILVILKLDGVGPEMDNRLRFGAGSNLTPRALRLQLQLWAEKMEPKSSSTSSAKIIGAEKLQLQLWKKWAKKL